jgi:hypothetical protein
MREKENRKKQRERGRDEKEVKTRGREGVEEGKRERY